MNNFLENDEHDCRDYCCSGRSESGQEGEDGNWNGKEAGVEGEWGQKDRDEGADGAN